MENLRRPRTADGLMQLRRLAAITSVSTAILTANATTRSQLKQSRAEMAQRYAMLVGSVAHPRSPVGSAV